MAYNTIHPLYPQRSLQSNSTAVASQSLSVSTASVGFGTAFNVNTVLVTFDVQDQDVRCRWDGSNPTGTVGHLLVAGSSYTWDKGMATAAKFIRKSTATADATIFLSELSC